MAGTARRSAAGPARLGIVDWGIGGLGLLALLDERLPGLSVTYWSDAGTAPYGTQRTVQLAARLRTVVGALAERGCTEVVLACNAASTVAPLLGAGRVPIPVQGIIGHGVAAVGRRRGTIGVVGGRRTIASGGYRRALAGPGRTVVSRVAQPLSAHIEAGRIGTEAFTADLRRIVAPLRGADALVLACTHYPAASDAFAAELPGTQLLDPAVGVADDLVARLGAAATAATGDRSFVTTGDRTTMRRAASAAWGLDVGRPTVVPV